MADGLQIIRHRVNRILDIDALDPAWGAEIDLRSDPCSPGSIRLCHEPYSEGDELDAWLGRFVARGIRGPIILNTKEDGLEARALELLARHGVEDFFFLDTAAPTLVAWTLFKDEVRFAVRASAYEPVEGLAAFVGHARWAWVDCFGGVPPEASLLQALAPNFKLCLVSPELQGRPLDSIEAFRSLLPYIDALCTKAPERWTGC